MKFKIAQSSCKIVDRQNVVGKPWMAYFLVEMITSDMPQPTYTFNKKPIYAKGRAPRASQIYERMKWFNPESYNTNLSSAREAFRSAIGEAEKSQSVQVDLDNIEKGDSGKIRSLFEPNEWNEPFLVPKASLNVKANDTWTQDQVYSDGQNVYDVGLLIENTKNNFEKKVKLKDYKYLLFDRDVWGVKDRPLSPMDVINDPTFNKENVKHMQRIRTADMSKPILIRLKTNLIVDGYHRLARAFLQGDEFINAKFVAEEQMEASVFQ
jgi:hypothetical protein